MDWIAEKGYHTGNIMNAFRLTLVGEGKGPHMFDTVSYTHLDVYKRQSDRYANGVEGFGLRPCKYRRNTCLLYTSALGYSLLGKHRTHAKETSQRKNCKSFHG